MATGLSAVRDELRQQHQSEFFSAYMVKARDRMTLSYNQAAIESILSTGR